MLCREIVPGSHPERLRKQHLGLCSFRAIPRRYECVARLQEPLGIAAANDADGRGAPQEQVRPLRVALRPEPERGSVEAFRRLDRVERRGAVSGIAQGRARRLRQVPGVEPGRLRELERLQVVVGQELRLLLRPAERVDPGRRGPMLV